MIWRCGRLRGVATGPAVLAAILLICAAPAQTQVLPGSDPLDLAGPSAQRIFDSPSDAAGVSASSGPRLWATDPAFDLGFGRPVAGMPIPLWNITPSIEVQAGATDNVQNTRTNRQADIYSRINPRLTLSANTAEVVGALTYSPRASIYANSRDQNRIDQTFNGRFLATIVPGLLFLDVRGSGDVRSVTGQISEDDGATDDRSNRVQATTYQISPYLVQRFGGLATARAGYAYRQSIESGSDAFAPGQSQPFFTSQDFASHEGFASIRSGSDWGRLAFAAQTSNTIYEGSGIYDGAHRYIHTLATRYALTREFAVLVDGGYQDERYSSNKGPFLIQEPIWGVGMRYAPDETSFLVVRYGQRDGFESFSLNAALDLGVRTRVFARYSEQITSSAQQAGDLLNTLQVDSLGNVVDSASGVPASVIAGSPLLASQSNLYKSRRAVAAASQTFLRDTFTLSLMNEKRDPVATASGTSAFSQESNSVSLSWSRALAPGTTLFASGRYGLTKSDFSGEGTSYGFQTTLARALTPSLLGSVQYSLRNRENDSQPGSAVQNTILVSLRQYF